MCVSDWNGPASMLLTLFGGGVGVGEEPEVSLVVPADQRHAVLHHHL